MRAVHFFPWPAALLPWWKKQHLKTNGDEMPLHTLLCGTCLSPKCITTAAGEEGGTAPWFWGKGISARDDYWGKRKKTGVGLSLPSPLPTFCCLEKRAPGDIPSSAAECPNHSLFCPNPHCSCTSSARNAGSDTGLGKNTSASWEWLFGVCFLTCYSSLSNFGILPWIIYKYLLKSLQRKNDATP